jgi:uncharacterized protein YlbG (UPF0298 family)
MTRNNLTSIDGKGGIICLLTHMKYKKAISFFFSLVYGGVPLSKYSKYVIFYNTFLLGLKNIQFIHRVIHNLLTI